MDRKYQIITDLFEYEHGNDFGWGVDTDTGGRPIVAIEDGGIHVTGKKSEPQHPDVIGATINEWYFYRKVHKLDSGCELVLVLETSKGKIKLSVYRQGEAGGKLRARIGIEDFI